MGIGPDLISCQGSRTGVLPLIAGLDQALAHGIVVDVAHRFDRSIDSYDVAVVATALLPESIWLVPLVGRQVLPSGGIVSPEILQGPACNWLLDRTQYPVFPSFNFLCPI